MKPQIKTRKFGGLSVVMRINEPLWAVVSSIELLKKRGCDRCALAASSFVIIAAAPEIAAVFFCARLAFAGE
jgi:hypothetical protein